MTDVRLTALNPEDSQVYPVACNSSGELKLEKQATFDGNLDGDLTVTGSAFFVDGAAHFANSGKLEIKRNETDTTAANRNPCFVVKDSATNADSAWFASDYVRIGGKVASSPNIELNKDGSANFSGVVSTAGAYVVNAPANTGEDIFLAIQGGNPTVFINSNGSATFLGDVVIGSRNKQWMLVEQGGLCHMVEQARTKAEYPKLRDVFQELNTIERCLEEVMTKLRMTEPDGWPVWDGSDNSR
jgi:hypothetical protein